MARIHLFEISDYSWFPQFLRNFLTDYLQFLSNKLRLYKPIIPVLEKVLALSKTNQIIDAASGSGGGLLWINSELKKKNINIKISLSDFYPNIKAFKIAKNKTDNIDYISNSVDVRNLPKNLKGLRTLFLSFHHFKPKDAKLILQNAVDEKNAIAIFEAQERSFISLLLMCFSPILLLFITPFIKPFKISRIFFSYVVPIIPVIVFWDGIVSALRTYSVNEMTTLVNQLKNKEDFHWELKRVKSGVFIIIYLIGIPKNTTN